MSAPCAARGQAPRRSNLGGRIMSCGAACSRERRAFRRGQHRVPRHRLGDGALPDLGRAVGDDGADGLRQPGARRLRDARRLCRDQPDEPARRAVRRRRSPQRRWRPRSAASSSSGCSIGRLYGGDDLDQVLLTMGLIFMSVAGATYFWGPLAQPMHPPRWLSGQIDLGFRSFPGFRSFLILCGAALVTGAVARARAHAVRRPASAPRSTICAWRNRSASTPRACSR